VRKILALAAIALLVEVLPAKAQERSRRASTEDLLNVTDMRSRFENNTELTKQIIQPDAIQTQDKIKDDIISVYAEPYTEDEMQGIIAFDQSPSGQAPLKKQPQLFQRTGGTNQKRMSDIFPKIQELAKQTPK
jgi:hypothetical protein